MSSKTHFTRCSAFADCSLCDNRYCPNEEGEEPPLEICHSCGEAIEEDELLLKIEREGRVKTFHQSCIKQEMEDFGLTFEDVVKRQFKS